MGFFLLFRCRYFKTKHSHILFLSLFFTCNFFLLIYVLVFFLSCKIYIFIYVNARFLQFDFGLFMSIYLGRVRIDPADDLINVSGFEWTRRRRVVTTATFVHILNALAALNTIDLDKFNFKRSQVFELERLVAACQQTLVARRFLVCALESR